MGVNTDSSHGDFRGVNLMEGGSSLPSVLFGSLDTLELPPGAPLVDLALIIAGENRLSPLARAYVNGALTYTANAPPGTGLWQKSDCRYHPW